MSCEFCPGHGGGCIVCDHWHGPVAGPTAGRLATRIDYVSQLDEYLVTHTDRQGVTAGHTFRTREAAERWVASQG
jgi:hypothetical protein